MLVLHIFSSLAVLAPRNAIILRSCTTYFGSRKQEEEGEEEEGEVRGRQAQEGPAQESRGFIAGRSERTGRTWFLILHPDLRSESALDWTWCEICQY